MIEKTTSELDKILKSTHPDKVSDFLLQNKNELVADNHFFSDYMKEKIKANGLLLQEVFLNADVPERYGYKLMSGEKRTKQRDIILRICYSAKLSLEETQKALKLYGMPLLYSRIPRDSVLMVCFNERPGSIIDVNTILKKNSMLPLRSSGTQE